MLHPDVGHVCMCVELILTTSVKTVWHF